MNQSSAVRIEVIDRERSKFVRTNGKGLKVLLYLASEMGWSSINLVMGFEQYQLQCRFRQVSKTDGGGLWGGGGAVGGGGERRVTWTRLKKK